jgi:hypothetical protein
MIRQSGNRFAEKIMRLKKTRASARFRPPPARPSMIRQSGNRLAEKIMRLKTKRAGSVQSESSPL